MPHLDKDCAKQTAPRPDLLEFFQDFPSERHFAWDWSNAASSESALKSNTSSIQTKPPQKASPNKGILCQAHDTGDTWRTHEANTGPGPHTTNGKVALRTPFQDHFN